jgi:hypothetical protein
MSQIDLGPLARGVNEVGRAVERVSSQVIMVQQEVSELASLQGTTYANLEDLRRRFENFLETNERAQLVQLAETRLGTLKSDLEREYGHYEVVRRSSIGTLQAFDVGNVRNKTVLEISEELMIQTPRYWLAPALVALAAWSRDDEDLAQKSLDAAFSRDKEKTSLLFALVLRRQGRTAEATRWLHHYFLSLDPRNLTREFALLLEAISQDGFGPEGRTMVLSRLSEWRSLLSEDADLVEQQVATWSSEVQSQRGTVDSALYPTLTSFCPDWSALRDVLERASAHEFLIEKYSTIRDTETPLAGTVIDRLDDLLEVLVSEFDEEELPLRREVLYQQSIIDSGGDMQRASEKVDAESVALESNLDILSLQTGTALRPDLFGASKSTQRLSIAACAGDLRVAVERYTLAYRSRWKDVVDFVLDDRHTPQAKALGFGTWRTTSAAPQETAERELAAHWEAVVQTYIDEQTFKPQMVQKEAIIAVAITLVAWFGGAALGILATVAAGGGMYYLYTQRLAKCNAAVANAKTVRDVAKRESIDVYRELAAEWVDAKIVYSEEDPKESKVLDLIEGWPR